MIYDVDDFITMLDRLGIIVGSNIESLSPRWKPRVQQTDFQSQFQVPQYSIKSLLDSVTSILYWDSNLLSLGAMVDVQVVSVLAFYSNDRSSKSTEIKLSKMLKNNEKKQKEAGDGSLVISLLRSLLQFSLDHAHFNILLLDS